MRIFYFRFIFFFMFNAQRMHWTRALANLKKERETSLWRRGTKDERKNEHNNIHFPWRVIWNWMKTANQSNNKNMRIIFSYFFYVSHQEKKNALRIFSWQTTFKIRTSAEEWIKDNDDNNNSGSKWTRTKRQNNCQIQLN